MYIDLWITNEVQYTAKTTQYIILQDNLVHVNCTI